MLFVVVRNGTAKTFDASSGFYVKIPQSTQSFPILTGTEQWKPGQRFVFYILTKKYYPLPSQVHSGFEFDLGGARSVAIPGPSGIALRIKYDPATFARTLDSIVVFGPGNQGGVGAKFGLPNTAINEFLFRKPTRTISAAISSRRRSEPNHREPAKRTRIGRKISCHSAHRGNRGSREGRHEGKHRLAIDPCHGLAARMGRACPLRGPDPGLTDGDDELRVGRFGRGRAGVHVAPGPRAHNNPGQPSLPSLPPSSVSPAIERFVRESGRDLAPATASGSASSVTRQDGRPSPSPWKPPATPLAVDRVSRPISRQVPSSIPPPSPPSARREPAGRRRVPRRGRSICS